MNTENQNEVKIKAIKVVESELKQLKEELISIAKEIKNVKDSETRKALFEEKKQIQSDIDEANKHLAMLNGEDESMPSEELNELLKENLLENDNKDEHH